MTRILMEYPFFDGRNQLFDGGTHVIHPTKLYSFTACDRPFFVLYYYDETMQKECFTLLAKIGEMFVKIPLADYSRFSKIMNKLDLKPASVNTLPENIYLGATLNLDSLGPIFENVQFLGEPVLDLYYDYAYLQDNPTAVDGRIYQSKGLMTSWMDKNQYYYFDKEHLCREASNLLAREMQKEESLTEMGSDFEVEFLIKVKEGTTVFQSEEHRGKVRLKELYLIPGIHRYKVYAAPCLPELDSRSFSCRKCTITAPKKMSGFKGEYRDLHDINRVFKDGFQGDLPVSFDSIPSSNSTAKGLFLKRY